MLALILLSKHSYLNYKNKQYKSYNLKLLKYKLSKVLNIVKCTEAVARRCSAKKLFLEISQDSRENNLCQSLFFKKEILAHVFSFEFCEISKNTYSYRRPLVAASECSRNLEFEKRTDQNFITQNIHQQQEYCISKKKNLLKQS